VFLLECFVVSGGTTLYLNYSPRSVNLDLDLESSNLLMFSREFGTLALIRTAKLRCSTPVAVFRSLLCVLLLFSIMMPVPVVNGATQDYQVFRGKYGVACYVSNRKFRVPWLQSQSQRSPMPFEF
jgi:hypothetical protein